MAKFTNKEINDFVKELIVVNENIWTSLCSCEELMSNDIIKHLKSNEDESLLKIIAQKFDKLSANSDAEFAEPELNDGMLADFEQFGKDINRYRKEYI